MLLLHGDKEKRFLTLDECLVLGRQEDERLLSDLLFQEEYSRGLELERALEAGLRAIGALDGGLAGLLCRKQRNRGRFISRRLINLLYRCNLCKGYGIENGVFMDKCEVNHFFGPHDPSHLP